MRESRTRQWILKAESDLKVGKHEILSDDPATDAIAFHMQQCVEKYLKAFLTYCGKPFRRTHDLTELITECIEIAPEFQYLFDMNIDRLTEYSVEVRYPEEFFFLSVDEARRAIELAEKAKAFILKKLQERGFHIE